MKSEEAVSANDPYSIPSDPPMITNCCHLYHSSCVQKIFDDNPPVTEDGIKFFKCMRDGCETPNIFIHMSTVQVSEHRRRVDIPPMHEDYDALRNRLAVCADLLNNTRTDLTIVRGYLADADKNNATLKKQLDEVTEKLHETKSRYDLLIKQRTDEFCSITSVPSTPQGSHPPQTPKTASVDGKSSPAPKPGGLAPSSKANTASEKTAPKPSQATPKLPPATPKQQPKSIPSLMSVNPARVPRTQNAPRPEPFPPSQPKRPRQSSGTRKEANVHEPGKSPMLRQITWKNKQPTAGRNQQQSAANQRNVNAANAPANPSAANAANASVAQPAAAVQVPHPAPPQPNAPRNDDQMQVDNPPENLPPSKPASKLAKITPNTRSGMAYHRHPFYPATR
ncbi:uncharacterized protein LOC135834001 [Planococcus citri]|uniref:uncharacterized protein LOC135834001 n=1 Tax=Planococcus citri TaxID=170843 RepID=UPI0031F9A389